MLKEVVLAAALAGCGGGGDTAPSLVAVGDSLTLQTGLCAPGDAFPACAHPDRSYASYLPGLVANLGRGGDTCTEQPAWLSGPHQGQKRGLALRFDEALRLSPSTISVLIGINDVNLWNVPVEAVVECVVKLWERAEVAGLHPVAVTYPLPSPSSLVFPPGAVEKTKALNAALRLAAQKAGVTLVDGESLANLETVDGVHPSPLGAQALAALWRQK